MIGDLKHGRTVHSLAKLLAQFDVSIRFVAPRTCSISTACAPGAHTNPNGLVVFHQPV